MKILVLVKQVPDPNAIRFDAAGHYSANTPRVVNEYDQYGLEESIQLKERDDSVEIIVASIGPSTAKDAITRGLAMGADSGILVRSNGQQISSLATSKVLARIADEQNFNLIWVGQETSDSGTGNTGPQLSALLDIPFVSNVVGFELQAGNRATFTREIEDGHSEVQVDLPVIACALSGLSEPRHPSLKGIMAARRKSIDERDIGDLADQSDGGDRTVTWTDLREEERSIKGVLIEDADPREAAEQLVSFLRERGLVS